VPAVFAALGLLATHAPSAAHALDYDCADFANQAEAEAYLLPGDPYRLDADHDGIACEDLPCPCSTGSPTVPPAPVTTPTPIVAPPTEPIVEEPEVVEPTYRAYVACSRSRRALSARRCPNGSQVGAFFESSEETTYRVCVHFPDSRPLCAGNQAAEAATLYVNAITTHSPGRHTVIWEVGGRRIVRHFVLTG
jgi:Excalibur calcium-binding domain